MKLIDYVNINQGTDSCERFSSGNTLPLVQQPFGFAAFTPQTSSFRGSWFYHPSDRSLEGIRITRQPSPWIRERGGLILLPQYDSPCTSPYHRWSGIRHSDTVLKPNYLKYDLLRARCTLELTPTNSGACIRVSFRDDSRGMYFSVIPTDFPCSFKICDNMLCGYTEGAGKNTKVYFVLSFNDGDIAQVISETEGVKDSKAEWYGNGAAAHIRLARKDVTIKLSTSLISVEQALVNMQNEHSFASFDDLVSINESLWEKYLSRITFDKTDDDTARAFYSCMYRSLLYPHRAYEISKDGTPVHYSPIKGSVEKGYRYTDSGFWDTYRTSFSMLPLIARDEYEKIIDGFINDYQNDGWLPRWTATEPLNCMPSTMIDPILADAAKLGVLKGERLLLAFEAMLKHANNKPDLPVFGREGCLDYLKLGYVPNKYVESVNLTLDAAYGDYCISEIAKILGKDDIAREYAERSKNYKNIFDGKTGFMRSRDENGKMRDDFTAESWGRDYTEASAWQTTFAVQHDLWGLAELFGGKEKILKKLDELFSTPPIYLVGGYGLEIHEMTEMAALDLGQCAISNQPSFHIPFIYAYFGERKKTEEIVRKICTECFSYRDDGFPGDEDNGSMACWYLFAAMGFYPITPGNAEFIRFNGILKNVRIDGKTIEETVRLI